MKTAKPTARLTVRPTANKIDVRIDKPIASKTARWTKSPATLQRDKKIVVKIGAPIARLPAMRCAMRRILRMQRAMIPPANRANRDREIEAASNMVAAVMTTLHTRKIRRDVASKHV
jgi:hypothetical protein